MKEAQIYNNKFSMNVPSGWEDRSIYQIEGPVEDGVKHNILLTIEYDVPETDLVRYADRNIRSLEASLQGYCELKRGTVTLDNGAQAFEMVYKWVPIGNRPLYQKILYILNRKSGFMLTATFSKKTWKTFGASVDRIMKSIALK